MIVLAIVLLIFGAAKLPGLARSVGQSMRIIKTELHDTTDTASTTTTNGTTPPAAAAQASVKDGAS